MSDHENFLVRLCICLFVVCCALSVLVVANSCSSSSKVVISKEVCNG